MTTVTSTSVAMTMTPMAMTDITTLTTEEATASTKEFFFFELERPGATILVGAISIVHSLFHLPHCLMYRRLGILTAFWSLVGAGLVFGAVVESEFFYDVWIWYSCVYVPVMLVTMSVVLTAYIWEMDMKLLRVVIATVAIMFYLFMFYCIVFVNDEKRKIFTTPSMVEVTTPTCATCPNCTTVLPAAAGAGSVSAGTAAPAAADVTTTKESLRHVPKFVRFYRHLVND